jgi:hypothetical protein
VVLKSIFFWDMTTCLLAGLLNYSSTLKMEAIRSSEMSGTTQRTTRRHIPEEDTLHLNKYFKLKFAVFSYFGIFLSSRP